MNKTYEQQLLDMLYNRMKTFRSNGQLKTFTKEVREELGASWYSEHAFRDTFNGKGLMQCIEDTFVHGSPYCILRNINGGPDILELERFFKRRDIALPASNGQPTPEPTPAPIHTSEPTPTPAPATKYDEGRKQLNAGFTLNIDLAELATEAVKNYVNESGLLNDVQERIKAEAAKLTPTQVVVNNAVVGQIAGHKHKLFDRVVRKAVIKKQVFLSGPAGTGKTTLGAQVAEALSLPFGHISCTMGMSEAHLLGRMVADGSYIESSFVNIYENGGVFLFDEMDAADANTLLIINSALANGHMSVPNRADKPLATRHNDCIIICAANTFGRGSSQYVGRNLLDAATMDRFVLTTFEVEYDVELERNICAAHPKLYEAFTKIRKNVKENRLDRLVSTRAFADAVLFAESGDSYADIIDAYFTGWTSEEKTKAKANLNIAI